MLFRLRGPTAEDDGSAWSWEEDGDEDRPFPVQTAPLVAKLLADGCVFAVGSGPVIVSREVAAALEARFGADFDFEPVTEPESFIQLRPLASVDVKMKDEHRLQMPMVALSPNVEKSAYFIAQNPPFVLFGKAVLDELKRHEPSLELVEVSVESP